jgi:hypothetical protein
MSTATEKAPVLDESVWNAWLAKGKRQERAAAKKATMMGGVVLAALVIGSTFYFLAGK